MVPLSSIAANVPVRLGAWVVMATIPALVWTTLPDGSHQTLLGVSEEALGRLERLPGGRVLPQLLGYADPVGTVGGEGLEPGKRRAARGARRPANSLHSTP